MIFFRRTQQFVVFILSIVLLTISCHNKGLQQTEFLHTANMKHAKYFAIKYFDNYKLVSIINPWDSCKLYAKYVLYAGKKPQLSYAEADIEYIKIPSVKFASLSSSFIEVMDKIDETQKIVAIDNEDYIYNKGVKIRIESGDIKEVGEMQQINIERLLAIKPDLLMATGWNVEFQEAARIKKMDIPVVYNLDWMEQSPLGRAEWMKFIAAFFDKDSVANKVFDDIESVYNELNELSEKDSIKPSVMHGIGFNGTWYMPGGNSYIANFYKDAGADYCFANNQSTGSVPMNLEGAISYSMNADIWLIPDRASTAKQTILEDKRYRVFKSLKKNKIYTNDKRVNDSGANDFWDSGASNPHRILADLLYIFHPELLPAHELYYYQKIEVE